MNKREKIIVIAAVLIALYGIVDYFFLSGTGQNAGQAEFAAQKNQIETYADGVRSNLLMAEAAIKKMDPVILMDRIESEWKKDPFKTLKNNVTNVESNDTAVQNIPKMIYSGFIQINNQFMAVIDGMEYMVGETIADLGLKIRQITPSRVVLQSKTRQEIILNIEEN